MIIIIVVYFRSKAYTIDIEQWLHQQKIIIRPKPVHQGTGPIYILLSCGFYCFLLGPVQKLLVSILLVGFHSSMHEHR